MSDDTPAKSPVKAEGKLATTDEGDGKKRSWKTWALGWVGIPGAIVGGLFGGGLLIGANFHDSWFTQTFVWVGELFW